MWQFIFICWAYTNSALSLFYCGLHGWRKTVYPRTGQAMPSWWPWWDHGWTTGLLVAFLERRDEHIREMSNNKDNGPSRFEIIPQVDESFLSWLSLGCWGPVFFGTSWGVGRRRRFWKTIIICHHSYRWGTGGIASWLLSFTDRWIHTCFTHFDVSGFLASGPFQPRWAV